MAKNLFVGGLPYATTDDQLRDLFSQCGGVLTANIIKDRYSGQSRGFGFVEMNTDEEARVAIEKLNGYALEGRSLVVKEALPKPAPSFHGGGNDRGGGRRDFGGRNNDRHQRRY